MGVNKKKKEKKTLLQERDPFFKGVKGVEEVVVLLYCVEDSRERV